jgi:hypothetical protein
MPFIDVLPKRLAWRRLAALDGLEATSGSPPRVEVRQHRRSGDIEVWFLLRRTVEDIETRRFPVSHAVRLIEIWRRDAGALIDAGEAVLPLVIEKDRQDGAPNIRISNDRWRATADEFQDWLSRLTDLLRPYSM